MKNIIIVLILLSLPHIDMKAQETSQSYTESFFNQQFIQLKKNHLKGRVICAPSKLDFILKNDIYRIATVDTIASLSSMVVLISNEKDIDWNEANNNCAYQNTFMILFEKLEDNKYHLSDIISQTLNQGSMALLYTSFEINNKTLYIRQFGGNRFGVWCTELEFQQQNHIWKHQCSKLYTAISELELIPKKLIWSKIAEKQIELKNLCFSDIFQRQELEWIIDGIYSENK